MFININLLLFTMVKQTIGMIKMKRKMLSVSEDVWKHIRKMKQYKRETVDDVLKRELGLVKG